MTQRHRPSDTHPPSDPNAHESQPEPVWMLAQGGQPLTREELLARYRRQRALPEDPFENGGKPKPPPGYRDMIMQQQRPAQFVKREAAAPVADASGQRGRGLSLLQTFGLAAVMALVAGAGVGMFNARLSTGTANLAPQPVPAEAVKVVAAAAPAAVTAPVVAAPVVATPVVVAPPPQPQPVQMTEIVKKPVPTATLQVADVAGETNSFIPLALKAEPASLGSDIMLKISGIPEGAYLTSGKKDEDQIWALTRADLKDLKLVVPEAQDREFDLAVAAFEPRTGELAAPVKTLTVALSDVVVEPASAPPPQQMPAARRDTGTPVKSALPAPAPESGYLAPIPAPDSVSLSLDEPDTPEARKLLAEGNSLFKHGDMGKARSAYEKAWKSGSAAGAYNLARSYDPVILAGLNIKKAQPDKAKALEWYERAATAGYGEAAAAIVRLRLKR